MTTLSSDGLKNYRIQEVVLNNGTRSYIPEVLIYGGTEYERWGDLPNYKEYTTLTDAEQALRKYWGQCVKETNHIYLDPSP